MGRLRELRTAASDGWRQRTAVAWAVAAGALAAIVLRQLMTENEKRLTNQGRVSNDPSFKRQFINTPREHAGSQARRAPVVHL